MSSMEPHLQQMHHAADDRGRAEILLRTPDAVLMKYAAPFAEACRRARFLDGESFVQLRVSALACVRDQAGLLPARTAGELETWRAAMARFVAGAQPDDPGAEDPPIPPDSACQPPGT